jgi:DNA-3-methyladenine glycosylase II
MMLTVASTSGRRSRELAFALHPVPPFRLDLTAWALSRRAQSQIDRWDGHTYSRVLVIGDRALDVSVTAAGTAAHPAVRVVVPGASSAMREPIVAVLERMLGLRIDLDGFYRIARVDRSLAPLAERFRGLKPPQFPSLFEAVVNGIACQQLSLTVGITLLGRLARLCGPRSATGAYAFPRPCDVAVLRPAQLRALGFSHAKTSALLELARTVVAGFDLDELATLDDAAVVEQLVALRGVGRWTAEYVLLRGLGRLAMFPGDDLGARTNLARWMKLRTPLDYDRVRRLARRWHPYAGFLYFHLLLQALAEAGALDAA